MMAMMLMKIMRDEDAGGQVSLILRLFYTFGMYLFFIYLFIYSFIYFFIEKSTIVIG